MTNVSELRLAAAELVEAQRKLGDIPAEETRRSSRYWGAAYEYRDAKDAYEDARTAPRVIALCDVGLAAERLDASHHNYNALADLSQALTALQTAFTDKEPGDG